MNLNINIIKNISIKALALISLFMIIVPNALAATFYMADNNDLRKGCPGTLEIMMNTEGDNVLAADSTMDYNPSEATLDSMVIGSALPMLTFNKITGSLLELSGSRLPLTGSFNGTGVFGMLNVTPGMSTSNMTINFSSDLISDNVISSEAPFTNLITSVTGRIYNVKDRYNKEVDGVGWCDPDLIPPTVTLILPPNGSGGNPVDTDIIFSLKDNRAGVNISTLDYSIGGVGYTETSSQTSYVEAAGVYKVTTNPVSNFSEGQNVPVTVYICDKNTEPGPNCRTWSGSFHIYTPPPPTPVCGDGLVTWGVGEQCDDGNTIDGDGCSALCLLEFEVEECPVCEECEVCEAPEEVVEEIPEEVLDEDEIPEEIKNGIPGCTREDIVRDVIEEFDIEERYGPIDAKCREDVEHCLLPFLINSAYESASPEGNRYYPDVYLQGERSEPLLEDDAGPIARDSKEAIHLGTRSGMVHGFYEDTINLSPFRPEWNMTRIQIIKVLNWAVFGQKWEYYDEYVATIGGEQNLPNVKKLASDLDEWWYPKYYNFACEEGVFNCDANRAFGAKDICSPDWKRDIFAKYKVFYRQEGEDLFKDSDNDSIVDRDEQTVFYTNPEVKDTDDDNLDDGDEITIHKTNPLLMDTDHDNLDDGDEINIYKTNPLLPDTDGDEVPDGIEIEAGTDPLDKNDFPADADGDGMPDDWEAKYGINPQSGTDDTDRDGLSDLFEFRNRTDPTNPDTDGDGFSDADEVLLYGTDPTAFTALSDIGLRITNIRDGMILTDLRPFMQGFSPKVGMEIEVVLRNEFGHEIVLGKTETDVNNAWVFAPDFDLRDGEFYLLAKGLDTEGKQVLASPLIGVTLDSSLVVESPKPERLSDVTITDDVLLQDVRVEIRDSKPILIGRTGFKNSVIATWQSVVGTSAIVADLAGGEFTIEAPKEMPFGDHTVSVYAIREKDQAVSKVVNLKFTIKEPITSILRGVAGGEELIFPTYVWIIMLLGAGGLLTLGIWLDRLRKRGRKK